MKKSLKFALVSGLLLGSLAADAEVLSRFNAGHTKQKLVVAEGCTFVTSAATWHDIESEGVSNTLAGVRDAQFEATAPDAFLEGKALVAE